MAKFAESSIGENREEQGMDGKSVGVISLQRPLSWNMYVDGAANQRGSGVGLVVTSLEGIIIEKSLRLGFLATNNEVECEALLEGMTMVQRMGARIVEVFSNSRLVVGQVNGELEARDTRMQDYLSQVRRLQSGFESFSLQQVPRSRNMHPDSLATLSSSSAQCLHRVILVEDLYKPAEVKAKGISIHQIKVGPS